ncbi:MAG: ATP-dependent RecD-like DNA helicase [Deltaproteobacteria bacterium]|nr:ATP-dependent RecD-like DNA helicase [Deltaproteobacteria bacterium]
MSSKQGNVRPERSIKIEGVLDKLVFCNPESDFIVASLMVPGRLSPLVIVGYLPSPHPGETLVLNGSWEVDKKFGKQFRFLNTEIKAPSTLKGIEKYLSSNLIKGIGAEMARRITTMFGDKSIEVIEKAPKKLRAVPGIGQVRADKISQAFNEQKGIRDLMLFLRSHSISPSYAHRIFKKFGRASIEFVQRNPYQMATEFKGIGFKSSDRLAISLGIDLMSPLRAEAGILHILDEIQSEGHVCYPKKLLIDRAKDLLRITKPGLESALDRLEQSNRVVIEGDLVYEYYMASAEQSLAGNLKDLMFGAKASYKVIVGRAVEWVESKLRISLSNAQKIALSESLENKCLIITGGPGTGKTTLLRALTQILEAKGIRYVLAAPTGRAAKRLAETTGKEAKTIHRLLEYLPGQGGFQRGPQCPIEVDFVVVDEVSMVDLQLMNILVGAIPKYSSLILVGDANQLPSIEPGNVLGDIIESGVTRVIRLDTIFRQAQESLIIKNAHRVNQGQPPVNEFLNSKLPDFFLIEKDDIEQQLEIVKELVLVRIPKRFGFDPVEDIQVLTPMNEGLIGAENLNTELRNILNPTGVQIRGDKFRVGDRVIQIRNNYEKEVFNGDIGNIVSFDPEWNEVTVGFDGKPIVYHVSELDEMNLAYAVTIHKSQGAEYKVVVIPLAAQHYILLKKNLLYTALTRGKNLVVLVSSAKALKLALEEKNMERRFTNLTKRLQC